MASVCNKSMRMDMYQVLGIPRRWREIGQWEMGIFGII